MNEAKSDFENDEAIDENLKLILSFLSNGFHYMQLWLPLFIAYKLVKKYYSSNSLNEDQNQLKNKLMRLFAYGKKTELSVILEENKEKEISIINTNSETESQYESLKKIIKFLICFTGLQISFLLWGIMQERIIKYSYAQDNNTKFKFKNSQFLVLCNRSAGFLLSFIIILALNRRKKIRKLKFLQKLASLHEIAPLFICSYSSLSNVLSSWFQYEALKYVSFTTQLLAKSSKSVFVMLVGRLVSNKKYAYIEYISVSIIAIGLYLFSDVEEALKSSKFNKITVTTLPGIICLICYLFTDSFTSTWQDNLLKNHKMSSLALMCITNVYSCLFTLISLIEQGELFESIRLMMNNSELATHILMLSITAAIGQIFIFVTIENYGALVFTLIMTTRQVISIILSCLLFNHTMTERNIIGITFIFFALFLQQFYKIKFSKKSTRVGANNNQDLPKRSTI